MPDRTPEQIAKSRAEFGLILSRSLAGPCRCGRKKNRQGVNCCRRCRDGKTQHSKLCRENSAK